MNNMIIKDQYTKDIKEDFGERIYKYDLYNYNKEHDHCVYCWTKISKSYDDSLRGGYHTLDGHSWFCSNCFNKYKYIIGLILYDPKTFNERYTSLLNMLHKELWNYDNKSMFELLRIKGIFEY